MQSNYKSDCKVTLEVMSNVFEGLQSIAKQLHIEKKLQIAKDCKLAVKDFFKSCLNLKTIPSAISDLYFR